MLSRTIDVESSGNAGAYIFWQNTYDNQHSETSNKVCTMGKDTIAAVREINRKCYFLGL